MYMIWSENLRGHFLYTLTSFARIFNEKWKKPSKIMEKATNIDKIMLNYMKGMGEYI